MTKVICVSILLTGFVVSHATQAAAATLASSMNRTIQTANPPFPIPTSPDAPIQVAGNPPFPIPTSPDPPIQLAANPPFPIPTSPDPPRMASFNPPFPIPTSPDPPLHS